MSFNKTTPSLKNSIIDRQVGLWSKGKGVKNFIANSLHIV